MTCSLHDITKYLDDTSLWEVCDQNCSNSRLQIATDQAIQWLVRNLMWVNGEKTKELVVDFGKSPSTIPCIGIHGAEVDQVESSNLLGIVLTSNLSLGKHVNATHSKA